jgi:putative two-component system response regulator
MTLSDPSAASPTVVLVDDDLLGLDLLDHLISGLIGARIMPFSNPLDALAWCRSNVPDVVILDYQMPEMNGIELLRALRTAVFTRAVPIMMLTAVDDRSVRQEALELGANDFLNKPIDAVEVRTRIRNMLAIRHGQRALQERSAWLAREVDAATAEISAREQETILRLTKAAEYRDWETGAHVMRVAQYSRLIAGHLGRRPAEQDLLFLAAPMHDIGKIGVPDHILLKPGRLDDQEFSVMKQHTVIGGQILGESRSTLLQLAAEVAVSHHERFDGSGYPRGISGAAIPIGGRIVAVADVYDALTSERPYKRPWQPEAAMAFLSSNRGSQFDPACVDAFLQDQAAIAAVRVEYADEAAA